MKQKVIVGMSGGVDSSVAALLLLEQGYEVVGAFMKNWSDTKDPLTGICSWKEERRDAMEVAEKLGIQFLSFDFEEAYREAVVAYMIAEYAKGRTPNPDVMCNKLIKFDLFLNQALAEGADFIATGHYARVRHDSKQYQLLAGVDSNKDQSYFLHQLNQEQLAKTIFPLGDLTKPQVRELAEKANLSTAKKKDSQGICFIGKVNMRAFLKPHILAKPGKIITTDGKVIGDHEGLAPYTIGQRHGFGVSGSEPYYVAEKRLNDNVLVVALGKNHPALFKQVALVENMHWISSPREEEFECLVRIRYRQPLQKARITQSGDLIRIDFIEPQRAVTSGQFAVLYDGDIVLGGGVIK